ncbi:acyl-CoA dehydrogenase/oxidase [Chytriomyces sp. MP71]|nr:acyl-CoA dehydrogenase/oxidase [Chytriomyces sp. MP71]
MKTFTVAELASHSTAESAFLAIDGKVYDVTDFLDAHPGGARILLPVLGSDASDAFRLFHAVSPVLYKYRQLVVGVLEGHELEAVPDSTGDTFGNLVAFSEPGWYQGQFSPYYNEGHRRLRGWIRNLVDTHMVPFVNEWDAQGEIPASLYQTFGKEGVLSCMVGMSPWSDSLPHQAPVGIKPEEWNLFHELIVIDEISRPGCGGAIFALMLGPNIALPAVMNFASPAMKERIVAPVLRGEKTICLAITEPYVGSDVAGIHSTAEEDGDSFIIRGEKKWITNGVWADYFVVAAKTGKGITLFLAERGMKGLSTRAIKCQGNGGSGTAFVIFDGVRVPKSNIIGELHKGFQCIMKNFNHERFGICIAAIRSARVCYEDAMAHAHRRKTFGKSLFEHGVIRNKLANMARQIEASHSWMETLAYQHTQMSHAQAMTQLGGPIALLKAQATQTLEYCAREASQILGGLSYSRGGLGGRIERIYRDVRGYAIPGGSEEIMLDLGMKQAHKISVARGAKF